MQEAVFSLVPEQAPIRLTHYYPQFRDYYFDCELQTKRWAVENIKSDWTIFDIGANVGIYTCLFGRLASAGKVYAFEPTDTIEMLRANIAAQKLANIETHRLAVGSRSGEIDDSIYRIWGAEPESARYDFTTLDRFVESQGIQRIDCVKIDVDGFDLEVLKGAERTLRRFNPWVLIELNHALATRGQSVSDAFLWFQSQGYGSALALDKENFLFRRENATTGGLCIKFDRDPVLIEPLFGPGEPLDNIFGSEAVLHNGATQDTERNSFSADLPQWSFLASWPVRRPTSAPRIYVEVDIEVFQGSVGIGCLGPDLQAYLGREVPIEAGPGVQTARLLVEEASTISTLMTRAVASEGTTRFRLDGVRIWTVAALPPRPAGVMERRTRTFDLEQCLPGGNAARQQPVEIVPVSELGEALGSTDIYVPPALVYGYGLADFKTEIDESALYRFIYGTFKPQRHLEFGTWEGFGAALCASSCDAEIWTVDLPTGELDAVGKSVYGARILPGEDSQCEERSGIGWRYRAGGFGDRVHQIFADSRELDVSGFGPGFFDSILIDGGHTADVVVSDTRKALPLLRSGGLMIWHDFCPDPAVLARSEAGRGVVEGIRDSFEEWRPEFRRVFWLRPSWLLIGLKR